MFKKYTPIQITIYWIIIVVIIGFISGFIANSNASGGEQNLFTYIAYSIGTALVGVILINLGTLFFYPAQNIKPRLLSLCFIIVSLIFLYPFFRGVVASPYDIVEKTRYKGSDKIDIKIQYFTTHDTSRVVRSESFWKNGKKDSVWTIYEKDGSVLKRVRYKNDVLSENIK